MYAHIREKPFVIEHKIKRICFGDPGYLIEWKKIAEYDTEEECEKGLEEWRRIFDDVRIRNGNNFLYDM